MAPRIRKGSKVHTIRKVTSEDLFPTSKVKYNISIPKNANGTVESVEGGIVCVMFKGTGLDWLVDLELLKAGWYVKKSK